MTDQMIIYQVIAAAAAAAQVSDFLFNIAEAHSSLFIIIIQQA